MNGPNGMIRPQRGGDGRADVRRIPLMLSSPVPLPSPDGSPGSAEVCYTLTDAHSGARSALLRNYRHQDSVLYPNFMEQFTLKS